MPVVDGIEVIDDYIESVERLPDESGGYSDSFARDYVSNYHVVTRNENIGPIRVEFAPGIPRVGDRYESLDGTFDPLSRCRKVTPKRDSNSICEWIVTCEFSTQAPVGLGSDPTGANQRPGSQGGQDDPTQWLPKRRWDAEEMTLTLRKDRQDRYSINTAGDFFDPLPTYQAVVPVLHIERIQSTFDSEDAADFAYAMNEFAFLWADPKQAQMKPITAEEIWIGNTLYWRVRYAIRFIMDWPYTWEHYILNAGFREIRSGARMPILDANGQQVANPVPLFAADASTPGQAMSAADIATAGPNWIVRRAYPVRDFAGLALPLAGL
jgi:hypothetical protein